MKLQSIEKFEYKYEELGTSIDLSMELLNCLGQDGWELITLETPKSDGDIYKALLKRKKTKIEW